ncbi:MAG TPA: sec-independent translocase [Nocardioidaceae bacterium]|nr:sec-independent translocase [Nocardioidaceae bacterium]
MFGIGLPELAVIIVVAVVVFGPDRLPEFARQAGRLVRQLRQFTQSARDDIRNELGPEFANFELTDLDPRQAVRRHIVEAWSDSEQPGSNGSAHIGAQNGAHRPLAEGERPPYDSDAT